MNVNSLITFADFALLFIILGIAFKLGNPLVILLTLLQIVPLAYFELKMAPHVEVTPAFYIDNLAIIMNLIISIIGSLICIFAIRYMEEHEHHLHLKKSRQPRFFFFLVLFLGAMNGLVFSNNLLWLYFFWEVTTFCSFMLIGHDKSEIAIRNATRALWMNMTGGVAFVAAIIFIYYNTQSMEYLSLQALINHGPEGMTVLDAPFCTSLLRRIHQIGPGAVPELALWGHGCTDSGVGPSPFQYHGKSRGLPCCAAGARLPGNLSQHHGCNIWRFYLPDRLSPCG